jgi:hypothetical protein
MVPRPPTPFKGKAEMNLETPKQAAERTIFTEKRIRAWISQGKIRHVRIDGSLFLPEGAIEELIERNTIEPCQDPQIHQNSKSARTDRSTSLSSTTPRLEKDVSVQQVLRTVTKLRKSSKTS